MRRIAIGGVLDLMVVGAPLVRDENEMERRGETGEAEDEAGAQAALEYRSEEAVTPQRAIAVRAGGRGRAHGFP